MGEGVVDGRRCFWFWLWGALLEAEELIFGAVFLLEEFGVFSLPDSFDERCTLCGWCRDPESSVRTGGSGIVVVGSYYSYVSALIMLLLDFQVLRRGS